MDAYLPLREDLILTSQASYVLELLDRFTYEDETENPSIFRLLTETLSRLASKSIRGWSFAIMRCACLIIWDSVPNCSSVSIAGVISKPKINSFHSARAA